MPDPQPGNRERADPRPSQPLDLDSCDLHQPPHEVINPLVNGDRDNDAIGRLAQEPDLLGDDAAPLDHDSVADPLELRGARPGFGQDVILLGQPVAGVHDPVGHIAVVGEEQQAFGIAVEPSNRVNAFGDVDQVHHGPPPALVADSRDVTRRLVQDQVAKRLRPQDLVVDANLIPACVGPGAEFGNDLAVDADATFSNQILRRATRGDSPRGEDALETFQGGCSR